MMNKEKAILEVVREMRGCQQHYFHSKSPVDFSNYGKSSCTPAGRANFAQIGGCRVIGDVILLVGMLYVLFR
jgi:hypothetical protein